MTLALKVITMITPQNLVAHELCGLKVEVVGSSDAGRIGTHGEVVWETQHTLVISTKEGEKKVPKTECTFVFDLPPKVRVEGAAIDHKPVERVKRGLKLMRRWR